MRDNLHYKSDELVRYFSKNRVSWDQFYKSERVLIERISPKEDDAILDVGCGCGGLGLALRERFGVLSYTGIEINDAAAKAGRSLNPAARIILGDILDLRMDDLRSETFDCVFSLSCIDWNVRFPDMLAAAWSYVRDGGFLVSTFRLTDKEGCADFHRSFQFINFEGLRVGEKAAYIVVNAQDIILRLKAFRPREIVAYGYWGAPSASAVTPYDRLCFSAFAIRKGSNSTDEPRLDLRVPKEIRRAVKVG